LFAKIWHYISNRGIESSHPEEQALILLYNQMALVTILAFLSISSIAYLLNFRIEYTIISFVISFFYIGIIVLNHFGLIYTSRLMISIVTPFWVCCTHLAIAGNFSQGLIVITGLVITYVSFSRKPGYTIPLMLLSIILYLGTLIYTQFNEPLLGEIDLPYDEFFAFFLSGGWIGSVIYAFFKDREQLIKDLQHNNKKLHATTEELERFTYIASHDLKSPLRTINSFVGLIERDIKKKNYESLPDRLEFVKTGAKQMNSLVEDILEISTLNNPDQKKKRSVDLNLVANKVCANLKEEIEVKNASLTIDKLPAYNCDEAEFTLLFQNMIQNGIKYNESAIPEIKISSETTNNQIIISFEDNGIGIEEEYHEQIFQFFKRLHTSDKYQGTGLGLGLCKKIVNSYGGYIQIFSEVGKGSIFQIILAQEHEALNN